MRDREKYMFFFTWCQVVVVVSSVMLSYFCTLLLSCFSFGGLVWGALPAARSARELAGVLPPAEVGYPVFFAGSVFIRPLSRARRAGRPLALARAASLALIRV